MSFKDMKISRKITLGFGVIILLILILGSSSYWGFYEYRDITKDYVLMEEIQSNVSDVRMGVKDFLLTKDEDWLDKTNSEIDQFNSLITQAKGQIEEPERLEIVDRMNNWIQEYNTSFDLVAEKFKTRNKLVALNAERGVIFRDNISEIMSSAFKEGDIIAAYYGGLLQENIISGRMYVYRFLDGNQQEDYDKIIQQLDVETKPILEILDRELQNPKRRQLLAEIKSTLNDYLVTNEELKNVIFERNEITENSLNNLGNQIASGAEEIMTDIKEEQHSLGQIVSILIIVIAILSVVLAVFITKIITSAIGNPLNRAVEAADKISAGDLKVNLKTDATDETAMLLMSMDSMTNNVEALVDETNRLIESAKRGQLDVRGDASKYKGAWFDLINGVNELVDAFVGPINVTAEYVDRVSKGDIPPKITDDYKGDFNEIKNNLNNQIDVMSSLLKETDTIIKYVKEGKLDYRANESKFVGGWGDLVGGVNNIVDSFVGPINVTAEYVDRISKGDLPPKITDEYQGDFNEIKNNLNLCIDSINALVDDTSKISEEITIAKFRERVDESNHSGSYKLVMQELNGALDSITNLFDSIPSPIMAVDNDLKILFMNKVGAAVGNKNTTELHGTQCAAHFRTPDCNTENCICFNVLKEEKQLDTEVEAHPGDLDLQVKVDSIPIKDKKGNLRGAIEIITDQTQVKSEMGKAEKILDYQKGEADKLKNALDELAKGNLDFNLQTEIADEDTKEVKALFDNIASSLNVTISTIKQLTVDLTEITKHAKDGDLEYRSDSSRHSGEYANIIAGVNEILDTLIEPFNEAGEVLSIMASGDLTARMNGQYNGDLQKLKNDINTLGESLSNLISEVLETVQTTASSALEISSTAESLAAATQEQSSQSDEVASAIEEMSKTVSENAQSAGQTAEMAKENGDIAKEGGEIVQQTVKKMRDIANVVQNSADSIKKLGESSKQIGEIISVIDDIADQTNLLALNAAIEAARAGEQGRGFAVVADEVRKLAERTTDATKKIADMIKGIQKETEDAVVAMNQGTNEVNSGIEYADKAGDSLNTILTSTTEVQDMINQIAAASEQQSATSEQISKNVVSISKVTSESAQRVEDVARTSEDLAKLTEHLQELMSQFKIDNQVSNFSHSNGNAKKLPASGGFELEG